MPSVCRTNSAVPRYAFAVGPAGWDTSLGPAMVHFRRQTAFGPGSRAPLALETLSLAFFAAATGCGGGESDRVGADASVVRDGGLSDDASDDVTVGSDCVGLFCPAATGGRACSDGGLDCQVNFDCPAGKPTTLTGTVYDPAGRNPIYDAIVFVPVFPASVPPLPAGNPTCNACETPVGDYVTAAVTDALGHFTLVQVPTSTNLPLVIQIGKWRRTIVVPAVADCAVTAVDPSSSRLPRNHGEGEMPQMALLTGGCDNLACFLRGVGVDAAEFSTPRGSGRVDVYQGLGAGGPGPALSNGTAGDCTTAGCPLWSGKASLERYDQVLLGCECGANDQTKPAAGRTALHDWVAGGGQLLAAHSQATWFANGPPDFMGVATWASGAASGAAGPFLVNQSFVRGHFLAKWLAGLGAADASGQIALDPDDVSTSVTAVGSAATDWIDDTSTALDSGAPDADGAAPARAFAGNVKALSFGVPLPPPSESVCGKVFFTDLHAGGGQALAEPGADGASAPAAVPAACDGGPLTPEEEALEFFLFDTPSCSSGPPPPPPIN